MKLEDAMRTSKSLRLESLLCQFHPPRRVCGHCGVLKRNRRVHRNNLALWPRKKHRLNFRLVGYYEETLPGGNTFIVGSQFQFAPKDEQTSK